MKSTKLILNKRPKPGLLKPLQPLGSLNLSSLGMDVDQDILPPVDETPNPASLQFPGDESPQINVDNQAGNVPDDDNLESLVQTYDRVLMEHEFALSLLESAHSTTRIALILVCILCILTTCSTVYLLYLNVSGISGEDLNDGVVTSEKMADNAVDDRILAPLTVDGFHLRNASVYRQHLRTQLISSEQIEFETITLTRLHPDVQSLISSSSSSTQSAEADLSAVSPSNGAIESLSFNTTSYSSLEILQLRDQVEMLRDYVETITTSYNSLLAKLRNYGVIDP